MKKEDDKKIKVFNMRMDIRNWTKLDAMSKTTGLSKSKFIDLLIDEKFEKMSKNYEILSKLKL